MSLWVYDRVELSGKKSEGNDRQRITSDTHASLLRHLAVFVLLLPLLVPLVLQLLVQVVKLHTLPHGLSPQLQYTNQHMQ